MLMFFTFWLMTENEAKRILACSRDQFWDVGMDDWVSSFKSYYGPLECVESYNNPNE